MEKQNNMYAVYDSMGRHTGHYIVASNLQEAYKLAQKDPKVIGAYWKLKRCFQTGKRT